MEFDTSVICHVFMHCFGAFLSQAMFLSLQVFAFKGQNMTLTVKMLFTCILRCSRLFTASMRRGRPLAVGFADISGKKSTNKSQTILIYASPEVERFQIN